MNELKFLEVMGKIDDDLVKEAEIDIEQQNRIRKIRSRNKIYAVSSVAAAAVIAIGSVALFKTHKPQIISDNGSSVIISDDTAVTTSDSKNAVTSVTTEAEKTTVTAEKKVTSASSASVSEVKTTHTNNKPITTSLPVSSIAAKTNSAQTSAAAFTADRDTGTASTVTSAVPDYNYEYEGSIIMKKFAAALAALTAITGTAVSTPAQAESYIPEISPTASSVKKFIEEYNVDVDLNSDGTIDIFDVYAMYRCELGPVTKVPDHIKEKYDSMTRKKENDKEETVIIDGFVFYQEPFYLTCDNFAEYFFTYYGLKPEYFDPNFYLDNCPDKYNDTLPTEVIKQSVKDIRSWNETDFCKTFVYVREEDGTFRSITSDEIKNNYSYNEQYDQYEADSSYYKLDTESSYIHDFIFNFKHYSLSQRVRSNVLMNDLINCGVLDTDINSDGVYDFDDIVLIANYLNNYTGKEIKDYDFFYYAMTGKTTRSFYECYPAELRESPDNPITEDVWNKAAGFMDTARYYFNADNDIIRYLTEDYLLENSIDPKYFDAVYYEQNHLAHYEYDEHCLKAQSFTDDYQMFFNDLGYFESFSQQFGPDAEKYRAAYEEAKELETYNDEKADKLFPTYYKNVKTGVLPEPDLDLDGKIDVSDYIIVDDIESSYRSKFEYDSYDAFILRYPEIQTDVSISQEAVDNYKNNFDFNNNGISCDFTETKCMRMYIYGELEAKYGSEQAVFDASEEYMNSHPELKYNIISTEKMDEFCKNNNVDFTRATNSDAEAEYNAELPEMPQNFSIGDEASSEGKVTEGIKGDSNCDEKVDISDSVLIMQSISNPSKYGVNGSDERHITEAGSHCADIDGEGVTNMDALTIQKYLLGLCSIK